MATLHSRRTYLYLFLFALSLPLIHLATHLTSQSTPQIVQYALNPSTTTLPDSYNNNPTMIIRYVSLRYGIYATLLCTYIFDRTKLKTSWLNMKTLTLTACFLFTILIASGRIRYNLWSAIVFPEAIMIYFGQGYIYAYVLILWSILALSAFHILKKKGLEPHQALWIASVLFFSCEEIWEIAPYTFFINPINLAIQPYTVTLYLWRAMPTILLFAYTRKFGLNRNIILTGIFFWAAATFSVLFATLPHLFGQFIWLLRMFWVATYIAFAQSLKLSS